MKRTFLTAFCTCLLACVISTLAFGATDSREEPVGLVLSAGTGKVLRANTETPLATRAGDILFAGDSLRSSDTPATFLYCPAKTSQTLDPASEVLLDSKALKLKSGKLDPSKPVNACFLPQIVRVAVASQQHYGVSMTRGLAKPQYDIIPFDSLAANVKTQLAPFEEMLKADPKNAAAWVQEAAVFDREKLEANALNAYNKVAEQWSDAIWVRGRIFELNESLANQAALKAAAISPDAKTYALMIGVSKYQNLPKDLWLQYADADAATFSQHLASQRGGGVPADQMLVLTNEQATNAAVGNAFQTFLRNRAGKLDTVFILIAAQGTVDSKGAYILAYDSDPQDLGATAISITDIQKLVDDELSKVGRVVLMIDVSRAANIGNLKTATIGSAVEKLGQANGEMLGLMASRPKEYSLEGTQFGGGHGAFTYSIIKGLQGLADHNDDRSIDESELISYVRENVPNLTANKQHPRDFGNPVNATKLSDLSKQGITLARFRQLFDSRNGGPLFLASGSPSPQDVVPGPTAQDVDAYKAAVAAKHLLPDDQGSAWPLLDKLRGELPPEQVFIQENALRVALEDQAQQVLLRYLSGDQTPQTKAEFDNGAKYMQAALRLTQESLYLEGRSDFFQGRGLLYDKQYAQAANLLEQAVRIDPGEGYGYNALGIAYLEQADFAKAIPAFRDAAHYSPNWSYPLHNLALAQVESGDYDGAIRSYLQAMKITPQFSYLPYNLGLVYQRRNQRREAEAAYRKALSLANLDSARALPLNALGSLKASEGKNAEAEKFYRDALQKDPSMVQAKYNLALLLGSIKGRQTEAVAAFKESIAANPDFLASRISLGDLDAQTGDTPGAIEQYLEVVKSKPGYIAARTKLASLYLKSNQADLAIAQLRAAADLEKENPGIWEQLGDAEKAANHPTEAKEAFATALKLQVQKNDRKRISTKMAF